MATHGEPANVSYLSHTELRIHELTFRTSPESFVISAVIIWKSNGNLSKESLQNLGNLSRSTRALCRLRFSQYFFRSSFFRTGSSMLSISRCSKEFSKSSWMFAVRCFLTLGVIGTQTATNSTYCGGYIIIHYNWYHETTAFVKTKLKLEETEKENNAESMQKRVRREAEPTVVYVLRFSACMLCQTAGSLSWIAKLSFLAAVLSLIILIANNVLN